MPIKSKYKTPEDLENFKPIPGHSQYAISEDGRVIRSEGGKTPNRLIALINNSGYRYCMINTKDGIDATGEPYAERIYKFTPAHRLVAITFIGPPPLGQPWVNHKNGIKDDNRVENLEWSSISQNIQHAHDTGLVKKVTGSDHWRYGKPVPESTRRKMGDKKRGEKHPKFKGWWVVNGRQFASTFEAERALGKEWYAKKVYRWCLARKGGCYFLDREELEKRARGVDERGDTYVSEKAPA
jgi:hypothetical protein